MRFLTVVLTASLILAGCAPRGSITVYPGAANVGSVQSLLVASGRKPAATLADYAREAGPDLSFSRMEVSVPPVRELGTVRFASPGNPDPTRDFLTVGTTPIPDRAGFIRAVNAAVARQPRNRREVFLFVHGFNVNFAEGLYRQAQMKHDFGTPGVSVHFAWPSAARGTAYGTDRETVLQARDDLEDLLTLLSRSNASRIIVAGHSMGAMIVMEALRQMAIRDRPSTFARIKTVILMAPDIDVGVFRNQAAAVAKKNVSIYVFTSARDRALRFSAALRGTGPRLGGVRDEAEFSGLPVTIIDLSEVSGNEDALNHFKVATSPVMISMMQGLSKYGTQVLTDAARQPGVLGSGVGLINEATSTILAPITYR